VLLALARYAGLRVPSESHGLTWEDVDFQRNRLRVHSVKTERHAGKALRFVPITANLRPVLDAAFAAREGTCVVTLRGNGYIHDGLRRIVRAAKVKEWPDLYQTLRSSFEKELTHLGGFHDSTAAQWTGHSVSVARKHYTHGIPDELYGKAAAFDTVKATQKATKQGLELGGKSGILPENEKGPECCNSGPFSLLPADSSACQVEVRGLEPLTFSMPSRRSPN